MAGQIEIDIIPSYFIENMKMMYNDTGSLSLGQDSGEKIPVDANDLANMTDTEFYLIVIEPEESIEVNAEGFKDTFNGGISEIVSRGRESIKAYIWGMVDITQEDENPLRLKRDFFDEYIFKIEDVEYPEGKPPILKGIAKDYSTDSNVVGKLEQKLTLRFIETPTFKQDLGYIPLE